MSKQCQACGHPFTPRSQNPNQKYCTNSECQRERRRRWQQQKRRDDADYRDNDARASKAWATENPEYWKRYRDENPAYAERNRNLQQHSPKDISTKTGLTAQYVVGILTLLQQGEERLLIAVETGRVPLNAALAIVGAGDDDKAMQAALQEAYECGKLRGRQLMEVRRIIERRQTLGRSVARATSRKVADVSTSSLVRTYQREVERQKMTVKKAELTQQRLLFVVSALRQFFADENFINLLRAEGLDTLPEYLGDRVWSGGSTA